MIFSSNFPHAARKAAFAGIVIFILLSISRAADPAGTSLAQDLVGNRWSWARGNTQNHDIWHTTLTFHPDGTITSSTDHHTWYWWIIDDQNAHLQFHPQSGPRPPLDLHQGMDLNFNPTHTKYRAVDLVDPAKPAATGLRKEAVAEVITAATVPFVHAAESASTPAKQP